MTAPLGRIASPESNRQTKGSPLEDRRYCSALARTLARIVLAASLVTAAPAAANISCWIDNPQKIGVGAIAANGTTQMDADLRSVQSPWYYDWQPRARISRPGFVPMIWSWHYVNYASGAPGNTLLTFNEPDHPGQANMTVQQAISYWPTLMASGKRLSSPAVTTGQEIGAGRWLTQFMAEVQKRKYRVDFIAVHYYTMNRSTSAFRRYLQNIHDAYKRPIWVTEFALVDWKNPNRYSETDQRIFFSTAVEMMDDLPFVERHAWFGLYDRMGGWDINSGLVEAGKLTRVGEMYEVKATC